MRQASTAARPAPLTSAPADAIKQDFARRLQKALVNSGLNQSELAREASKFMPKGRGTEDEPGMTRDLISKYIRAKILPGHVGLNALAKALRMKPEELLPSRGGSYSDAEAAAFDMRDVGEGKVWLRVNQAVPMPIALKIAGLLNSDA